MRWSTSSIVTGRGPIKTLDATHHPTIQQAPDPHADAPIWLELASQNATTAQQLTNLPNHPETDPEKGQRLQIRPPPTVTNAISTYTCATHKTFFEQQKLALRKRTQPIPNRANARVLLLYIPLDPIPAVRVHCHATPAPLAGCGGLATLPTARSFLRRHALALLPTRGVMKGGG